MDYKALRPIFRQDAAAVAIDESGGQGDAEVRETGEDGEEEAMVEGEDPEDNAPRKARIGRVPRTPTKAEIEEHLPLHIEYREWCPDCVAGKSTGEQHRMRHEEEALGTTVSVDYAFMVPEEQEQDLCPI